VGAVVAEDYRTAGVFERAGIDFCCKGNRTIESACEQKHVPADELISQLQQAVNTTGDSKVDYASWPLDQLALHIENKHHRYVTVQIPVIQAFLDKIVRVHGGHHPELAQIKENFDECAGELAMHMKKEELMLFPFIGKMVREKQAGSKSVKAPFGTVENPIRMMMHEHDSEGERFRRIKELSNQYTPPADGCATYKAAFATLQAFEEDLHLHIHLENNILFPRSIELQQSFA
jgi:regulator of cell morphogenesis and NO signaling